MKKKIFLIFMTLFLIIFANVFVSLADSGWDYDYDSGSDWGSSDWSSSDWSSSDWSSSDGDFIGLLIFLVIILGFIISCKVDVWFVKTKLGYKNVKYKNVKYVNENEFTKYPEFNKEEFLLNAFEIYKEIQKAWSEFDYDTLRKLTTDELYNMYKMQLETLTIKNERNVMTDFYRDRIGITGIKEENGVMTVDVVLRVYQKDYVVNALTNDVVRGDKSITCCVEYNLTFVSNVNNKNILTVCPNCGAPIKNSASQKCEYCNSDLIGNSEDTWVLAKKEILNQSKGR